MRYQTLGETNDHAVFSPNFECVTKNVSRKTKNEGALEEGVATARSLEGEVQKVLRGPERTSVLFSA